MHNRNNNADNNADSYSFMQLYKKARHYLLFVIITHADKTEKQTLPQ